MFRDQGVWWTYLPLQEGGFIRKRLDELTHDEGTFVEKTHHCDCRDPRSTAFYNLMARQYLFKNTTAS